MVRACNGAGAGLRANNSLAGVAGSSGLASGGIGFGLTVPLSCAAALQGRSNAANNARATRGAILRQLAPPGALIIVMCAPIESSAGPSGACADSQVGGGLHMGRVKREIRPGKILPALLGDILNGYGVIHSITISPTMPWSAWLLPSATTPQRKSVTRPAATGTNHYSAVWPG